MVSLKQQLTSQTELLSIELFRVVTYKMNLNESICPITYVPSNRYMADRLLKSALLKKTMFGMHVEVQTFIFHLCTVQKN